VIRWKNSGKVERDIERRAERRGVPYNLKDYVLIEIRLK
jgi:hypothetical protein